MGVLNHPGYVLYPGSGSAGDVPRAALVSILGTGRRAPGPPIGAAFSPRSRAMRCRRAFWTVRTATRAARTATRCRMVGMSPSGRSAVPSGPSGEWYMMMVTYAVNRRRGHRGFGSPTVPATRRRP